MNTSKLSHALAVVSGLLLLIGIARASTDEYAKKRETINEACATQRNQQGLTDRGSLYAKYPTPEISLTHLTRIVPGATVEVAVPGKFAPGTQFLFDNDALQVIQQSLTPTGYHATVRAAPGTGPGLAVLHAFTPESCAWAAAPAVYIGGKFAWELTASNGWRITLHLTDEKYQPAQSEPPTPLYSVQFYRGAETQPFETRDLTLLLTSSERNSYSGSLGESAPAGAQNPMAEIQEINKRIQDPHISDAEREKLTARISQLTQQMIQQQSAGLQQMQDPNYAKNLQEKRAEFGCEEIQFQMNGTAAEGSVTCGEKVGTLQFKGVMRYLGP
jgi:hypothetical protein